MTSLQPCFFVGHGSPMNAIEDNKYSHAWEEMGKTLDRPHAILCISAHWETNGPQVTAMESPRTIYDFYGFPPELYAVTYPAPGSIKLAERVRQVLDPSSVEFDLTWGLDHGCWSVLKRLFPTADIPVVQFGMHKTEDMRFHYDLGKRLKLLREEGILLFGSGNIVHNLQMARYERPPYDWAIEYDNKIRQWILDDDHEPIIQYKRHGQAGLHAVNSGEHYKPLLYILGAKAPGEAIHYFAEDIVFGSIGMRSVMIG